jgi:hypothetical protein
VVVCVLALFVLRGGRAKHVYIGRRYLRDRLVCNRARPPTSQCHRSGRHIRGWREHFLGCLLDRCKRVSSPGSGHHSGRRDGLCCLPFWPVPARAPLLAQWYYLPSQRPSGTFLVDPSTAQHPVQFHGSDVPRLPISIQSASKPGSIHYPEYTTRQSAFTEVTLGFAKDAVQP